MLVAELSDGRMADVVILTPTTLTGDLIAPACAVGSKDARIVATAIAPMDQRSVELDLFSLSMFNQTLMGTVFGSMSPRVQIPRLLKLYAQGHLEVDELITQRYSLDQVQAGYDDLAAGKNVRGIVDFGLARLRVGWIECATMTVVLNTTAARRRRRTEERAT